MGYNSKYSGAEVERLLGDIDNKIEADNLKTINGESIVGEGNLEIKAGVEEADIVANEKVTAAALCDLDGRVKKLPTTEVVDTKVATAVEGLQTTIEANYSTLDSKIDAEVATLAATITSNEKVAAAALNDLNNRIQDLANSVIGALNTEV